VKTTFIVVNVTFW